jgi:DNA-binding beta-propeller fold protein YncE
VKPAEVTGATDGFMRSMLMKLAVILGFLLHKHKGFEQCWRTSIPIDTKEWRTSMNRKTPERVVALVVIIFSLVLYSARYVALAARAQQAAAVPKFQYDPFWPKPLPGRWVTGNVKSVCIDSRDHVFTLNLGNLNQYEQRSAKAAPSITEFDPEGNLVNSWGDKNLLPGGNDPAQPEPHGCFVDHENNIWIGGNLDAIVQKYTHDGSKLLLQIGTKGKFDSSDGTRRGTPNNSSTTLLNRPSSIAVDRTNGDVYIADGYGNRRIVVFDRQGRFLRQWGRQGTLAEANAGVGGAFLEVVHSVVIGNDNLVYVGDRVANRIQIFDKMGNFKRNMVVESYSNPTRETGPGSTCWTGFSPDAAQKFMYVGACGDGQVWIVDRQSGQSLASFGRPGDQPGGFGTPHTLAVDSRGNVVVGDNFGRKIQMWRLVR